MLPIPKRTQGTHENRPSEKRGGRGGGNSVWADRATGASLRNRAWGDQKICKAARWKDRPGRAKPGKKKPRSSTEYRHARVQLALRTPRDGNFPMRKCGAAAQAANHRGERDRKIASRGCWFYRYSRMLRRESTGPLPKGFEENSKPNLSGPRRNERTARAPMVEASSICSKCADGMDVRGGVRLPRP